MKKHLLILLLVCLLPLTAIGNNPNNLFPSIKGWDREINDVVYDSYTLWEYIDGAADIYLAYDFENLFIASYTDSEGKKINVELYRHSSPENAFGIYSAERMADYSFVDVGVQGYYEPGILNFLSGHYYVKMSSAGKPEAGKEAFFQIAEALTDVLGTDNNWPPVLRLFPEEGKAANAESYIARDFLGYSILHSAFTAEYNMPEEFKMFIIKLPGEPEASSMLHSYTDQLNENKVTVEDGIYIIQDLFNGTVFMALSSNYLIGVINTSNKELAADYINKVRAKL